MTRAKARTGWIGVDIGTRTVKLAQLEHTASGYRLARAVVRCIPPAAEYLPGGPGCDGADSEQVRSGLLMHDFRGRRAAAFLASHETDLRCLSIPAGSNAERRAMIANELANQQAGAFEDCEFDYWDAYPANESPAAPTVNVLSVPRASALRRGRALLDAGLECQALDGQPLTLCRAVQLVMQPGSPAAGIIDWGFSGATFCAVAGGQLTFARHLRNCGLGAWLERIRTALDLSLEQAESLLADYGVPDPLADDDAVREVQDVVADAGAGTIDELVEETQRTVSYLANRRADLAPARLWLAGGGATIRNIAPVLSSRLDASVQVWSLTGAVGARAADPSLPHAILSNAVALSLLAWEP